MSVSWFVVWVPSSRQERQEESRSRSTSFPADRACSQTCLGSGDTEEEGEKAITGNCTNGSPERPKDFVVTKVSEDRPVLEKLAAIQEDRDLATSPMLPVVNITLNEAEDDSKQLDKQESYDSHVKRGAGGEAPTTPLTPGDTEGEHTMETTTETRVPFLEREPMEVVALRFLETQKISPIHVVGSSDGNQTQISFCVPQDRVEGLLLELQSQGVGHTTGSSVSVLPASVHCSLSGDKEMEGEQEAEDRLDKFYSSIKSRLLVSEVVARIQAGAEFSFDFLFLLVLAGLIAIMGLLEDSSVVLVASMLVSPLMGPILAGIFGGVIQDKGLTWRGVRHEVYALIICIVLGFLFGLPVSFFAEEYGVAQWPTREMLSRGELRALWVGVLVAVPSGAGVALSVLGGNAGSLVGVAISASLLPPAVNAGILWALATILSVSGPESHALFHGFGQDPETNRSLYEPRFSPDLALESFCLGLTSLALTLINILCIILTGVLILKLKEVTPEKIPQNFAHFWRKDIKAHRAYNKKIRKEDSHGLLRKFSSVLGDPKMEGPEEHMAGSFLHSMFERATHDEDLINIQQWVAMPTTAHPPDRSPWEERARHPLANTRDSLVSPNSQTTTHTVDTTTSPANSYFRFSPGRGSQGEHNNPHHLLNRRRRAKPDQGVGSTFLNVPDFLQQELNRSREVRRQLREQPGVGSKV